MTHDPLHNVEGLSGALYDGSLGPCRLCEFAARVRADERSMCAGAGQNHNENVMELTEDAVKDSSQILK